VWRVRCIAGFLIAPVAGHAADIRTGMLGYIEEIQSRR
jgi:hypothetical protein